MKSIKGVGISELMFSQFHSAKGKKWGSSYYRQTERGKVDKT